MSKRLLVACVVALGVMLLASLLTQLFALPFNREIGTPLGPLPVVDLLSVFVAMLIGAVVARSRAFRWIAPALQALLWVTIIASLYMRPGAASAVATLPLSAILRYQALALGSSLLAAFLGALAGEWLLRRRPAVRPA